ncbi:MAG: carbon-nitrogen hydrolase family protein [Acidilobaceae archaeon]
MSLKIGIIHERVKLDAKRTNTRRLSDAIRKLKEQHERVKIIVLPAYPFTGPLSAYNESKATKFIWNNAERIPIGQSRLKQGSIISTLIKWSMETDSYIISGPIAERAGPKIYLTVVVVSPKGYVIGKYRKIGLSRIEEKLGVNCGREPGILRIDELNLKLGLFADDDLAYPEIFKTMVINGVNIAIGFLMPFESQYLGALNKLNTNIITMNMDIITSFLLTRSRETGLPIILVGGAVDIEENVTMAIPTIPVEPDIGVIKSKILGLNNESSHLVIELNVKASKPREISPLDIITSKLSCKIIEENKNIAKK